jgi:hypothetical protein
MNDLDKKEFAQLMTGIGEVYSKDITKTLLVIYFDSLKGFSINDVKDALSKHAIDSKHGTFFPKPADIVRNIDGASISTEDRAMTAWMAVEAAIGSVGSYGTLKLQDKQAMMAIKAIGSWQQLCATDRDKLAFKRQEFIANYRALENTPVEMLPESLAGIAELANQRREKGGEASNLLIELEKREGKK